MAVAVDQIESRAFDAAVAELVDAPGLGPGAARREGSSPFGRTSGNLPKRALGSFFRNLIFVMK